MPPPLCRLRPALGWALLQLSLSSASSASSSRFPAALWAAPPRSFSGSSFPRLFPSDSPPLLSRASPLLPAAPPLQVGLLRSRPPSSCSSVRFGVAWSVLGASASSAPPSSDRLGSAPSGRAQSARRRRSTLAALRRARASRSPRALEGGVLRLRRLFLAGGSCSFRPEADWGRFFVSSVVSDAFFRVSPGLLPVAWPVLSTTW